MSLGKDILHLDAVLCRNSLCTAAPDVLAFLLGKHCRDKETSFLFKSLEFSLFIGITDLYIRIGYIYSYRSPFAGQFFYRSLKHILHFLP